MCDVTADQIERSIRELVTARETSLGIEIAMPLVYPNGAGVSVIVSRDGDSCVVHDAGYGAMHLSSYGAKMNRALVSRLEELVAKYGCKLKNGRVQRKCTPENLALVCAVVANASRAVGDQVLELRRYADSEFRDLLTQVLRETLGKRLRENVSVLGGSGRTYRVSHVVMDSDEASQLAYIVPVSSRSVVPSIFAELFDINMAHGGVANDVIYNEDSDLRLEDRKLLENVCDLIPFSDARERIARFG